MPTKNMSEKDSAVAIAYKDTLNKMQQCACKIAQEHLESSFNMEKSIGFQKWKREHEEEKQK
jgi:hypothetical protein